LPPRRPLIGQGAHLGQRLAELLRHDIEEAAQIGDCRALTRTAPVISEAARHERGGRSRRAI